MNIMVISFEYLNDYNKKFICFSRHNIRMLDITRKNCYKCDLETIIDPNDSQYFWVNLKDFEVETERNWRNIFNKHGNSSTLKYRRELTPSIQFQPDRIFTRNDLFERIIKSCKATNVEFLMLKEKLGLCLYEVIYDEQESEEIFKEEKFFTQHDVENEQLRKENEQLRKNNERLRKNNVTKDATIKESIKKSMKESIKNQ